jgi:hypothetical protein
MIWDATVPQLLEAVWSIDTLTDPRVTLRVWEEPRPHRQYCVGADFAYGIGRDWDTACVFDLTATTEGDGKPRQVAEYQGQLGTLADRYLYGLCRLYNSAFLCGERQVGLMTLQRLWLEYGYRRQYVERSEASVNPGVSGSNPKLGWNRSANDLAMQQFRRAVNAREVILRSPQLVEQMADLRWVTRSGLGEADEPENRLQMKLRKGGSPDLVMAAVYGFAALRMATVIDPPKPQWPKGSMGALLNKPPPPAKSGVNPRRSGWIETE